jgi:winged helix DNA-binding protein
MRVLTLRELNRATLARQLLLERSSLSVPRAIERVACLQAQWPPAPYVGLWSRLAGFDRRTLERLILRRAVVKATLMRSTLHLATARDNGVFATALDGLRSWGDAVDADAEAVAGGLRRLCLERPITFAEAVDYIEREHGHRDFEARRVWYVARRRAHIHHAPETALWTSKPEGRYVASAEEPDGHDPVGARAELARRYLAAFGPATAADLAGWSGLRVSDFKEALDELEPLRRFRSEEGRELLDLPRAPLPPPDTAAPVRFLPKWDSVLLAHADRRRVLPEEYRKVVIGKNGDVAQTVLVDGVVAGTWRLEGQRIEVTSFAPLPRVVRAAVDEEASRLTTWIA